MTTTFEQTIRRVLNLANPNDIADALRKVKLGNMMSKVKVTVTGAGSSATILPTGAAFRTNGTVTIEGIDLADGEELPPIGTLLNFRVTAGAAGVLGRYPVGQGFAPTTTTVAVHSDGSTLTLEAAATAYIFEYMPGPAVDLDTQFAPEV